MVYQMNTRGAVEIDAAEHIYVHPDYVNELQDHRKFNLETAHDILEYGTKQFGDRPLFSFRSSSDETFQSYTYKEVHQIVHQIGRGMIQLGLKASNKTHIGIYASANVYYALFQYACWPYSLVPVGIYDSLGLDAVRFVVKHAGLKLVFADNEKRIVNLIDNQDEESKLETIVTNIEPSADLIHAAQTKNLRLITYNELITLGTDDSIQKKPPQPSHTALIMYTSGSTGNPKGCMITHDGLICSLIGTCLSLQLIELAKEETPRVLNFLPLAHMFGCGTMLIITYLGGEFGFWQGQVEKLMDDFRDFHPTVLPMVPRLLNKLHDKVMSNLQKKGVFASCLMGMAIRAKLAQIDRGDFSQNTIWDRLIFNKVRSAFGGRVKRVISSSAPLSPDVARLSRAIFSCFFIEGYGQTECITGAWQIENDIRLGEVGVPTPVNTIKLVDVPEKEYYAVNRVGEICIRSRAVFKGYWKEEEKTREAIDADGWLHTGDIGRWTEHNTLKIIDRKKNIYKLSNGEYVAPEKIEGIYGCSRYVSQVFVYGDSFQHALVGIVVLDDETVREWMESQGNSSGANVPPSKNPKLRQVVLDDMTRLGKARGLMSYEQVKRIAFIEEPFTIENDLLTPTFKARRYAIEKKYADLFQELYKTLSSE